MINIFVLCKSNVFIKAVAPILGQHGIFVVDICLVPDKAISKFLACSPRPDIVLLDANWHTHGYSGTEILSNFFAASALPPKVIMVTTFYERLAIKTCQVHGVKGYFYRNTSSSQHIVNCIKDVYSGREYFALPVM